MEDLAPYTYLLIFAVLALLNYVMQRIAKWLKQQQAAERDNAHPSPAEVKQQVEELKRRREALHRQDKEGRIRVEESTRGLRTTAAPPKRVRSTQEEPAEVRAARARARHSGASVIPMPDGRILPGVSPLLRGRRSLRQAIVMMTVLGPCRAQQPPDVG